MRRTLPVLKSASRTHEVFNQSRPLENYDPYFSDAALNRFVSLKLSQNGKKVVRDHAEKCGSTEWMSLAELAEKNKPILRQFDNYGRRIDVIDYHQSYHQLMGLGIKSGAAAYGFKNCSDDGSWITRAAIIYLQNQVKDYTRYS